MPKVLWRGTASSMVLSWVIIAAEVFALGAVVMADAYGNPGEKLSVAGWVTVVIALSVGLVISLLSSRIAVEADDQELRVRFGFGWPVHRIPWATVEKVECIDVRPWQWGGWGYKMNLAKRSSAVILRAGEGLKVTLGNGRVFVVTVDGAKRGLEAIREILNDPRHA
jgi:hypothetical protein